MYLKVLPAATRTVADPVATTAIELKAPGKIFFVSSSGLITKALTITESDNYEATDSPNEVSLSDLDGIEIQNVPASSSRVYVFATLPEDSPVLNKAENDNISECLETTFTVDDVASSGTIEEIPLFGDGPIVAKSGGDSDEFEANVEITPMAGRIELAKLTADATITSFKVTGVYVNKYYASINFNFLSTTLIDNLSDPEAYAGETVGYPLLSENTLYNEQENGIESIDNVVGFGSNKVLAYNLLSENKAGYFPHLVIKIEDVMLADATDQATYTGKVWFITVKEVRTSGTLESVDFETCNVYHIANLPFAQGDLSPIPEPGEKRVNVTVTVKTWVVKPVEPVLN
jgi:hypothetical protein